MIPAAFDYVAPTTVEDALAALREHGDDAKVLAGGQSLLPVLRLRLNAPEMVIDLGRIDALKGISESGDEIVLGAAVTHDEVAKSDLVKEHAALLALAAASVADPQIRHRGTLGGALAHADPAGDLGGAVLALDATMVLAGANGNRLVAASDFFVDLFETAIGEDELLVEVRIPKHTGWGAGYEKFVRTAQQWPIVAVGATVRMDGDTIAEAKIAMANMGSTPLRAAAAEAALAGAGSAAVGEATAAVGQGTNPPSDLNGDAEYRQHLAGVLAKRAVAAASS